MRRKNRADLPIVAELMADGSCASARLAKDRYPMKRSILLAVLIALGLAAWVASGMLFRPHGSATSVDLEETEPLFTVRVRKIKAESFTQTVVVRGRTEAIRSIELKSEIDGRVVATPVDKGARVEKGALLCKLATNEREANLAQARALVQQRKLEYEAARELSEKEFRSPQALAQAKAQYEAALAQARQMEVALENTELRAPFDAWVEDRPAEIGDFLIKGGICALLVDEHPYLVVGEVSEQEVATLAPGGAAQVKFAAGGEKTGAIRYVSATAQERTRTFRIEVEVPNADRRLREGMTAEIRVPVKTQQAHFLPPAVLVLDSDGRIGVRTVDESGQVAFHPVEILSDGFEGIWVSGLPQSARLITVGQEFVTAGQRVAVAFEGDEVGA